MTFRVNIFQKFMILLTNNKNNHKYERSVFKANFQWDYCLVKLLGIVPVTLQLYTSQRK